jgi:EpsI family protein
MVLAAIASVVLRPSEKAAQPPIVLERAVPKSFADWHEVQNPAIQVINPQTQELLDKLYSQVLTRTYSNAAGYRIMLSMAYGDDQRGGLQAHRPEVCYPAQGFTLRDVNDGKVATAYGKIDVRRLLTTLGPRNEPVTYWLTVGDRIVAGTLDMRLAQIRREITGQIPDGVLFRVSSIDDNSARAFSTQELFAADMIAAVSPDVRRRLSGLEGPSPGAL